MTARFPLTLYSPSTQRPAGDEGRRCLGDNDEQKPAGGAESSAFLPAPTVVLHVVDAHLHEGGHRGALPVTEVGQAAAEHLI